MSDNYHPVTVNRKEGKFITIKGEYTSWSAAMQSVKESLQSAKTVPE